jgi:hypothetical protein
MNIIIESDRKIEISSLSDLRKIIPHTTSGRALNYGQGEGQIEINGTIWGMYCGDREHYLLQYEEGLEDWSDFKMLLQQIMEQIQSEFGPGLKFIIEGKLEHYQSHEKYT